MVAAAWRRLGGVEARFGLYGRRQVHGNWRTDSIEGRKEQGRET